MLLCYSDNCLHKRIFPFANLRALNYKRVDKLFVIYYINYLSNICLNKKTYKYVIMLIKQ